MVDPDVIFAGDETYYQTDIWPTGIPYGDTVTLDDEWWLIGQLVPWVDADVAAGMAAHMDAAATAWENDYPVDVTRTSPPYDLAEAAGKDASWADEDIDCGAKTLYRLREGIERFMITDINNPASSAQAQSEIACWWDDWLAPWPEWMNHLPGGGNVLFMDGHVEFIRYNTDKYLSNGMAWVKDADWFSP